MIRSMTGYGKGYYSDEKRNVTVEIKSVNHRYLDMNVKMSRKYGFAEEYIKSILKGFVSRGKIDISIQVDNIAEGETEVSLNSALAIEYVKALDLLKQSVTEYYGEAEMRRREESDSIFLANFSGMMGQKQAVSVNEIKLEHIAGLPEVITTLPSQINEEEIKKAIKVSLESAAKALIEMSSIEGENLAKDIKERTKRIAEWTEDINLKSDGLIEVYREKLLKRIENILEGHVEIPEERIAIEAAIVADKSNVMEEIVRLRSHLDQINNILENAEKEKGKKIDFIVQELNRETNTIGSKTNELEVTNIIIEMKSEIEKIREQIQNIQ